MFTRAHSTIKRNLRFKKKPTHKLIESRCRVRARDALHVASAMLGGARYFLSCDRRITEMKQARCYRRLAPPGGQAYFSAMNPTLFAQKLEKGEIE